MITAATLDKQHLFLGHERLELFQKTLLEGFVARGWRPHAWACLSNHYHLIAMAPEKGDLSSALQAVHARLGLDLNKMDHSPGRQVMYQFWDRCITYDSSYFSRMNYVIQNPVKHGLVSDAKAYPYCSAAWFERNNQKSYCRRVYSYKWDKVEEPDDFDVEWER